VRGAGRTRRREGGVMTTALFNAWERAKARITQPKRDPTPLEIFDWAVVRQSDTGPTMTNCANAFGITVEQVRKIVTQWNDPRGSLRCTHDGNAWRVDATYNATG
jgi:hypothetical protein